MNMRMPMCGRNRRIGISTIALSMM
jgi:hypothetical protein